MANVVINEACNLRCSYCFANQLNCDENNISLINFQKAVEFILKDNHEQIGIMGGEPTLHPNFSSILHYLKDNAQVEDVILFTNGVNLENFIPQLSNKKFRVLFNCNSPEQIGISSYKKMIDNIRKCITQFGMGDRVAIGVNIYSPDIDYTYIFDILRELQLKYLRISIVVPNTPMDHDCNVLEFFAKMKSVTFDMIKKALKNGIMPVFDCNKPPVCWYSHKEREEIIALSRNQISNILLQESTCYPVIDILQDLTAIRCMGCYTDNRVRISDFQSIHELRDYFRMMIDEPINHSVVHPDCEECYYHQVEKCNPGCLIYKMR